MKEYLDDIQDECQNADYGIIKKECVRVEMQMFMQTVSAGFGNCVTLGTQGKVNWSS